MPKYVGVGGKCVSVGTSPLLKFGFILEGSGTWEVNILLPFVFFLNWNTESIQFWRHDKFCSQFKHMAICCITTLVKGALIWKTWNMWLLQLFSVFLSIFDISTNTPSTKNDNLHVSRWTGSFCVTALTQSVWFLPDFLRHKSRTLCFCRLFFFFFNNAVKVLVKWNENDANKFGGYKIKIKLWVFTTSSLY